MEHKTMRLGCFRWLALPTLLFALLHVGAATYGFRTSPVIAVLLLGWALLFGVMGVALWRQQPNVVLFSAWVTLVYLIVATLRPLLFAQSDYARGRWMFLVVINGLVAIIPLTYLVIYYTRRGSSHGENKL